MTTVVATFVDGVDDPAVGLVRFTPRQLRNSLNVAGGIVAWSPITVPLDGYGVMTVVLEPGDYNVALVLQGTRTFFGSISLPNSDIALDLNVLLSDFINTPTDLTALYGSPGSFEQAVPSWVNTIEWVAIGGGGGGGNSAGILTGQGGYHGFWNSGVLRRNIEFQGNMTSILGTVGSRGFGGPSASDGQSSTVVYTDTDGAQQTLAAGGGPHGGNGATHNTDGGNYWPHSTGAGSPQYFFNGQSFSGGPDVSYGQIGSWPGGGGGGGILFTPGGAGNDGYVQFTLKAIIEDDGS